MQYGGAVPGGSSAAISCSLSRLTRLGCGWLAQENPDLFKWLTGQLEPPERLMNNPVFVVSSITSNARSRGAAKCSGIRLACTALR